MLPSSIQHTLNDICCPCVGTIGDPLYDDHEFVTRPIRIGDFILFYGRRKSQFPYQCLVGPDWPFIVVVLSLIIVINAVILGVISPLGWPPVLIGIIGALILLGSYSMVAFSDPGIVYRNDYQRHSSTESANQTFSLLPTPASSSQIASINAPVNASSTPPHSLGDVENGGQQRYLLAENHGLAMNSYTAPSAQHNVTSITRVSFALEHTIECGICQLNRPMTARHCSYCKTCILELDHHCPWHLTTWAQLLDEFRTALVFLLTDYCKENYRICSMDPSKYEAKASTWCVKIQLSYSIELIIGARTHLVFTIHGSWRSNLLLGTLFALKLSLRATLIPFMSGSILLSLVTHLPLDSHGAASSLIVDDSVSMIAGESYHIIATGILVYTSR